MDKTRVLTLLVCGSLIAACVPAGPGDQCVPDGWQGCAGDYYCAAVGVCTKRCSSDDECRVSCLFDEDCPSLLERCVGGYCSASGATCSDGFCEAACSGWPCDHDPYAPKE